MKSKQKYQEPFALKCQLCGTIAESWSAQLPIPYGHTAKVGYCDCGALGVDALGTLKNPDLGRIIASDPRAVPRAKS